MISCSVLVRLINNELWRFNSGLKILKVFLSHHSVGASLRQSLTQSMSLHFHRRHKDYRVREKLENG